MKAEGEATKKLVAGEIAFKNEHFDAFYLLGGAEFWYLQGRKMEAR